MNTQSTVYISPTKQKPDVSRYRKEVARNWVRKIFLLHLNRTQLARAFR